MCELTSAADALDMKPLVDLTSRALARMIEGKSAEEIRWDTQYNDYCAVGIEQSWLKLLLGKDQRHVNRIATSRP